MEVVKKILERKGTEVGEMDVNEMIEVEGHAGVQPLTIEKVREDSLSVAHYHSQRGDLMRDPEIVFDVSGGEWTPIEFRQDGFPGVNQYNPDGVDLEGFDKQWSDNLKKQGFVQAVA